MLVWKLIAKWNSSSLVKLSGSFSFNSQNRSCSDEYLICAKKTKAGYHWDCSDWANQSQNPLPNITEVPGSEIPDSLSFHSNESNESNGNSNLQHDGALHNGTLLRYIGVRFPVSR